MTDESKIHHINKYYDYRNEISPVVAHDIKSELSTITKPVLKIIEGYLPERVCMDDDVYNAMVKYMVDVLKQDFYEQSSPSMPLIYLLTNEDNNPFIMDVLNRLRTSGNADDIDWLEVYLLANNTISNQIFYTYKDLILQDFDPNINERDMYYKNPEDTIGDYAGISNVERKLAFLRTQLS